MVMTDEQVAIRRWLSKPAPEFGACGCTGPQDGNPVCPCRMKMVEKVNGKFWMIEEHRSPDGITHTARVIERVRTPEEIAVELAALPLKERLERKWKR